MAAGRTAFQPECLNRLDEVVVFDPLTTDELAHIVELQVREIGSRLVDRRIVLDVTPAAREWLAIKGYDPACPHQGATVDPPADEPEEEPADDEGSA